MRSINKTLFRSFYYVVLSLFSLISISPALFMFLNSFLSQGEILRNYGVVLLGDIGAVKFHLIPDFATLDGYAKVFFLTPSYLIKFWNSLFLSLSIAIGQVFVACVSGYGFAKFRFTLRKVFLYLLIILMLMPVQVTLVSNYILFDKIGLIGSWWPIILSGIFFPFGVFLMSQVYVSLPTSVLEAAKIDGASQWRLFLSVALPYGRSGIAALFILSFIDSWNMVEQPLVFLKDYTQYPLSIFLTYVNAADFSVVFVCGVLAILPVFLLFLYMQHSLIYGIEFTNLK